MACVYSDACTIGSGDRLTHENPILQYRYRLQVHYVQFPILYTLGLHVYYNTYRHCMRRVLQKRIKKIKQSTRYQVKSKIKKVSLPPPATTGTEKYSSGHNSHKRACSCMVAYRMLVARIILYLIILRIAIININNLLPVYRYVNYVRVLECTRIYVYVLKTVATWTVFHLLKVLDWGHFLFQYGNHCRLGAALGKVTVGPTAAGGAAGSTVVQVFFPFSQLVP